MAFTAANNFRTQWSEETTLEFLTIPSVADRMNGTWDGDAQTAYQVFIQRPDYSDIVATKPALKAAWGTPNEASARRLTLTMENGLRVEHMLYVQDELVNAVRTYRARNQRWALSQMRKTHEDEVVSYIAGLTAGGSSQTVNGNAGPIVQREFTASGTGFSIDTGMPTGTAAQVAAAQQWILQFLLQARVGFDRAEVPADGQGQVIGGSTGTSWAIFPPELLTFGLLELLISQGFNSVRSSSSTMQSVGDDIMRTGLRDAQIIDDSANPTMRGHLLGFDLYVSNRLAIPATTGTDWAAYCGHDAAVSAPLRSIRNYVTSPENASAERYEFRHQSEYDIQLANAALLQRATFNSVA